MTTRWAREGGGLPNVWVANPDGSAQRRLFAKKGSGGLEGTFSPTDADLMFFTRFKEKPFSDIYRGSLATGEVARVIGGRSADLAPTVSTDGTKDEVNPKWMPAGQSIVFEQLRERSPRLDIASITPDGSDVRVILSTKAWRPTRSPRPTVRASSSRAIVTGVGENGSIRSSSSTRWRWMGRTSSG